MRYGYLLSSDVKKTTITRAEYDEIEELAKKAFYSRTPLKAKPYLNKLMVKATYFSGRLYRTCYNMLDKLEISAGDPRLRRYYEMVLDLYLKKLRAFISD